GARPGRRGARRRIPLRHGGRGDRAGGRRDPAAGRRAPPRRCLCGRARKLQPIAVEEPGIENPGLSAQGLLDYLAARCGRADDGARGELDRRGAQDRDLAPGQPPARRGDRGARFPAANPRSHSTSLRKSESLFLDIRGLRYHVRRWPGIGAPKMLLLHGWMDVSASFQFVVDALRGDWDIYAPDWRGYGLTGRGQSDCYWFPDYIADLDFLLAEIHAVNLVGHSLGGNVASMYAGIRPQRVARLVNLEGFGLAATRPGQAPGRYARWLGELPEPPRLRPYRNFQELAERLRQGNPRLTPERAEFLARHWGRETEQGEVVLRGDPAHKIVNPVLYRY